ncbi:DUF411 domain-containing protein [Dongia sp.]|uniref:DUF411 domain-containing protein n=1 Tax=Dongia sp. TaxID=1977262 RepID=UPI00374FFFC1
MDRNRRHLLQASLGMAALGVLLPLKPAAAAPQALRLIKHPGCACCEGHAAYLRQNGYAVTVETSADLDAFRQSLGIPRQFFGCHTILGGDYVIEGHVPAAALAKLFAERPAVKGIAVPGMPLGSPGMSGQKTAPLVVYAIAEGEPVVFLTE